MSLSVQVLYFARAREATGGLTEETIELDAAAANTEHLKAALVKKHPALSSVFESAVLAVNQEYATEVGSACRRRGEWIEFYPLAFFRGSNAGFLSSFSSHQPNPSVTAAQTPLSVYDPYAPIARLSFSRITRSYETNTRI